MPQATDNLRQQMDKRFGSPVSDAGPMKFLESAGYRLRRDWHWMPKEGVTTLDDMTQDEYDCLVFLVQEWDMGNLFQMD